jgi:basic amino acid/polyamine antiporter, APA family
VSEIQRDGTSKGGEPVGGAHASGSTTVTLRRDLGLLDAVGVGLGAIVGAGIFVVSGVAAGLAGPAFLLGLLLAAVVATANALSSAQLAAVYPQAGATYEYGYRLISPAAGYAAGWMFLSSKLAAAGTVALGLAGYLEVVLPGVPARAIAVTTVVVFTLLNYFGIRRTSRVNLAIVALSVGSLLLFVLIGIPAFRVENLRPFAPLGWGGTLQSAAILFFAYTGYARIATLAEEVKEPERTIPRAISITIVGAVLLYLAVAAVAVGAIGATAMGDSAAPLRDAAGAFPQQWMVVVVSVGAVTAMAGVMLSQILGLSRMAFAMARRRDLPLFLAAVHPVHGVPGRAVLVIGLAAALIAATGTLRTVASAASFTILAYYFIANVAALRVAPGSKLVPDAVPWIGLVGSAALAVSLAPATILTGVLLLGAGFLLRSVVRSFGF